MNYSKAVQSSVKAVPRTPYSRFVISPCYGGFGVSETGMNLYRQKYEAKFRKPFTQRYWEISRQDPLLVEVVQELGKGASTECSKLVIFYVSNKYVDFLDIGEYDGFESVDVDVEKYKVATSKLIVKDVSITAEEKIQRIDAILHDDCDDSTVFEDLPEGGCVV